MTSGRLQIMSAGSEDVTIDALYSTIRTRDDGRWRLRHQHASLIPQRR